MYASSRHRSSSRPSTPSSGPRYLSPTSPSRSSQQQPIVLPFPDIPVRPISLESSRASSPLPTPPIASRRASQHARINNEHATVMNITASSDSADGRGILNHSSSQLASSSNPSPRLTFATPEAGPSRLHQSSTPSRPVPVPSVNVGSSALNDAHALSLSSPSMSPPQTIARATSLPTQTSGFHNVEADTLAPSAIPAHLAPPPPVRRTSSTRSNARPAALQITPPPPHNLLAAHMHNSFLKGLCADVRLVISKWHVAYHVHKMVLTQAGR